MIIGIPRCMSCRHFKKDLSVHWFTCTAFPQGIPNEILYGRHNHIKKYPGDQGIRFEEKSSDDLHGINTGLEKSIVPDYEGLVKTWDDWSKFRKPVYEPHNKKSVSACKKFARMGIVGPGCVRTMKLAEELYEPGKDNDKYLPPETVDPMKMFSDIKADRKKEQEKVQATDKMDRVFDVAYFYRNPAGKIIIMNWASLSVEDKKMLSSLFDERGVLMDTKHREFDKRFKDYNTRRTKRGLDQKRIS